MINIEIRKSIKLKGEKSAFISFPYDYALVCIMRSFLDRFHHTKLKEWELPLESLELFRKKATKYQINMIGEVNESHFKNNLIPVDHNFKTEPKSYQYDGINYGLKNNKFILGDEQGLGKTKQVIDLAEILKKIKSKPNSSQFKHCLIICGVNTLKDNWMHEIEKHGNLSAYILGTRHKKRSGKRYIGKSPEKLEDLINLPDAYFLITNVESLNYKVKVGMKYNKRKRKEEPVYEYPITNKLKELVDAKIIDIIAFDEFHKCKNPDSERSKQILNLKPTHAIAMTGTPLMNSPLDLYIPLKWIDEENHNFYQFKNHFVQSGGFKDSEVIRFKNLDQLQKKLERCQLRRLKKDVLDLPDKIYINEYLDMDEAQWKIYEDVKAQIIEDIDRIRLSINPLGELIRLRQATGYTGILSSTVKASIKFDRSLELLEDIVANDEKCIIFSNWTELLNPLYEMLSAYNPAIITGKVKDRKEQELKFMNKDSCRVILGTIGAMGTGLTLTAANNEIFLDEPWNKANKDQAEDRGHRIGTTKNVNIYTLLCQDTVDEKINNLVECKGDVADFVVDGKLKTNSPRLLNYLLGI